MEVNPTNPMTHEAWSATPAEVSTTTLAQMDELGAKIQLARQEYELKKKASAEAHGVLEELQQMMIGLLKANGRTKYEVEGVGLMYFSEKESYTIPKDPASKVALFNYISSKYGVDVLNGMISINHNTLNSWANEETKDGLTVVPGLDAPTMSEVFYFRRK